MQALLDQQVASVAAAFKAGHDKVVVQPERGLWDEARKQGWVVADFCCSTLTAVVKKAPDVKGLVHA